MRYINAHEEHATTPLTISPNHHGWPSKILRKLLDGKEVGVDTFCIHREKYLNFYADYDAWNIGSDYLIHKIRTDNNFIKQVYRENVKLGVESVRLVRQFERADITKWSNRKLADFMRKSYQVANDFSAVGFIPVFSDHLFHKFTHVLKKIVRDVKNKSATGLSDPEIVHLLSSQSELLPSKLARIALLKLILSLKGSKFSAAAQKKITNYYRDWFWVDFGQLGPRKTLSEVTIAIKKMIQKQSANRQELQSLLNYPKEIKAKQKKLTRLLDLNLSEQYMFNVARQFMYLKGLRMEDLFGIYACWAKAIDEMAKRFKIDRDLFYYASITEIVGWLTGRALPDVKVLQERQKYCVWVAKTEDTQLILTGERAKKFLQSISYKKDENLQDVLVIHGTVASLGYAKGPVKIVNKTEEINKVKAGDILVSVATHPGLLPAMKKAIAFVTDSGGITSHAAIVAREMQKPCIIGTKIATKVLKDGEVIELDTKKGDIKRVRE